MRAGFLDNSKTAGRPTYGRGEKLTCRCEIQRVVRAGAAVERARHLHHYRQHVEIRGDRSRNRRLRRLERRRRSPDRRPGQERDGRGSQRPLHLRHHCDQPGTIEIYTVPRYYSPGNFLQLTGLTATTGSTPRSIAIDPTGRFLYTANSGDSTISMFRIAAANGSLTQIGAPVAAGASPTSIAADYSGKFVYVVSGNTNSVLTYAINPTTGALSLTGAAAAPTGATPGRSWCRRIFCSAKPAALLLHVRSATRLAMAFFA